MKRYIIIFCLTVLITGYLHAQERLSELPFNPQLYYKTLHLNTASSKQGNSVIYIFMEDTIQLPFFDDFSSNTLIKYSYSESDVDKYAKVGGLCISENVTLNEFMYDTSWNYIYVNDSTYDSTAKPMLTIYLFNDIPNCTSSIATDTALLWPAYYNKIVFDSLGDSISGSKVNIDTILFISNDHKVVSDAGALWIDNYAYINNTYPVNPVTIGVATLDGLNELGRPYDYTPMAYGKADYLTSKAISLKGLYPIDSVYLSFYFQPQGIGDYPNKGDSLILEFKVNDTTWVVVWENEGDTTVHDFTKVMIPLIDSSFFHDGFRIRFRNYATISGNNDHWHIDYVYLDKNRSILDTTFNDAALKSLPATLITDYHTIPWAHYDATNLASSISIKMTNLSNAIKNSDYSYDLREELSSTAISSSTFSTNIFSQSDTTHTFDLSTVSIPAFTSDSILLRTTYSVDGGDAFPFNGNDTIVREQMLSNYFAYDDGSAEKAYGLFGIAAKLAYRFTMDKADTLRAIAIHFAHMNVDLSSRLYSLVVWSDNGGKPGGVLYNIDYESPTYFDGYNGFYVKELNDPLFLSSGAFWIGMIQTTEDVLNIGFDMNNDAKAHLYYDIGNGWIQTQFTGALMIRPLVGKKLPVSIFPIQTPNKPSAIRLFPNPATDMLYFTSKLDIHEYSASIYDYTGTLVLQKDIKTNALSIRSLPSGFYFIRLFDSHKSIVSTHKFLKID